MYVYFINGYVFSMLRNTLEIKIFQQSLSVLSPYCFHCLFGPLRQFVHSLWVSPLTQVHVAVVLLIYIVVTVK